MSKLLPKNQADQDRVHDLVTDMFKGYRIDRDATTETVLWLNSIAELPQVIKTLRIETGLQMDRLSDLTAYDNIDGADGPKRFVMVYQLYSMRFHSRIRVKVQVGETEKVPTITSFWRAANWLEREVYDLFGIVFEDHPDLRRIMMDERFQGHPLRKEYEMKDRQPFPDSLPVRIAARAPDLLNKE
ncbi:MAG: NADH-quinone oxidoreductase subunit C [Proteobacteria bacterium]|nr:MAG: NADH-quinone oxidoreductase subunit C [Pseudomonadota bacterium]